MKAARLGDQTLHGGKITAGSKNVLICGRPAARLFDSHECPIHVGGPIVKSSVSVIINGLGAARETDELVCVPTPPPRVTTEQVMQELQAFLDANDLSDAVKRRERDTEEEALLRLSRNDDRRREFLAQMAVGEHEAGKTAGEIMINAVQRSQVLNEGRGVDVGEDIGMLFYGASGPLSIRGPLHDDTYNVNLRVEGRQLPFTGIREEFRNDDPSGLPDDGQTHHIGGYMMLGTQDAVATALLGLASDCDAPRERAAARVAYIMGVRLRDRHFDAYEWYWQNIGDPTTASAVTGNSAGPDAIAQGSSTVLIDVSAGATSDATQSLSGPVDITDHFIEKLKTTGEEAERLGSLGDWFAAPWTVPNRLLMNKLQASLPNLTNTQILEVVKGDIHAELQRTPIKFKRFKERVATGEEWDYKNQDYAGVGDVQIATYVYKNDVPGNFAYGYTGAAAGFSLETLKGMAGLAQLDSDISTKMASSFDVESNYDDPRDQAQIEAGYRLYQEHGRNIGPSELDAALKSYYENFDN